MRSIHGTPRLTRGFPYTKTPDSKGWNSGVVHTNGVEQNARWDRPASLVATEQSSCDI